MIWGAVWIFGEVVLSTIALTEYITVLQKTTVIRS